MATAPVKLMTVEEFQLIPNPPGGIYELFHGELVKVGFPEFVHTKAQHHLREKLAAAAGLQGKVVTEMPYRVLPEYECWGADVAYITLDRWNRIDRWLEGAPDLVVEILSPSNTASEMMDKEQLCLENGAREFWQVDTKRKQVKVTSSDGRTAHYKSGQRLPLFFAQGESISVDAIFE
jgi:Uma2 family endonuclease